MPVSSIHDERIQPLTFNFPQQLQRSTSTHGPMIYRMTSVNPSRTASEPSSAHIDFSFRRSCLSRTRHWSADRIGHHHGLETDVLRTETDSQSGHRWIRVRPRLLQNDKETQQGATLSPSNEHRSLSFLLNLRNARSNLDRVRPMPVLPHRHLRPTCP